MLSGSSNRSSDAFCSFGLSHRLSYYSPQIFDFDVSYYFCCGVSSISSLHLVNATRHLCFLRPALVIG